MISKDIVCPAEEPENGGYQNANAVYVTRRRLGKDPLASAVRGNIAV